MVEKVAVIGAGQVGPGIAQVFAQSGKYTVYLFDIQEHALKKGIEKIKNNLSKAVEKKRLTPEAANKVVQSIIPVHDLREAVNRAEFIVEAVPENVAVKKNLLSSVENLSAPNTIIVSNTSSISITELGSALKKPMRFAGMHFFNPAQIIRLIEVIPGKNTSESTINAVVKTAQSIGKEPVIIHKDVPGFVVNRLLMLALNEAAALYESGIASIEDIDKSVKLGLNWPMGPLELIDLIGVDTVVSICNVLEKDLGSKYKPSKILSDMCSKGLLGRKTGKGFYKYNESFI